MASRGFRGALVPFNARDAGQQPDGAARKFFRVGDAIMAETFFQVLGFSHVQNAFIRPAHQVNGGALRQVAEELFAKSVYQWFGMRKKPELTHGAILPKAL